MISSYLELFHFLLFKFAVELNFSKQRQNERWTWCNNWRISYQVSKWPHEKNVFFIIKWYLWPLLSPFIMKGKVLLRSFTQVVKLWLDWDDKMLNKMYQKWKTFFNEMYKLINLSFKRYVKPIDAVKNPTLIIFSDAGKESYEAVCYVGYDLWIF